MRSKTDDIYYMNERAREPENRRRTSFFVKLEEWYHHSLYKFGYYRALVAERAERLVWMLGFSCLFLLFIYQLCFVKEDKRISNDYAKMGAFLTALCLVLLAARNSRTYRQLQSKRVDKESSDSRRRAERRELRDKH